MRPERAIQPGRQVVELEVPGHLEFQQCLRESVLESSAIARGGREESAAQARATSEVRTKGDSRRDGKGCKRERERQSNQGESSTEAWALVGREDGLECGVQPCRPKCRSLPWDDRVCIHDPYTLSWSGIGELLEGIRLGSPGVRCYRHSRSHRRSFLG